MRLVLVRHGESEWNKENRFTGWTDVPLSETGKQEARQAGIILKEEGYSFDVCYTSLLKRAIDTLNLILEEMDMEYLPVVKDFRLNERHYGALQGLNKADTAAKFGEEQVKIWRRSFDVQPPSLDANDERNPAFLPQYAGIDRTLLPLTESLKDTIARAVPYFENEIKPKVQAGDKVLIVAHGNSLRGLVKYFDGLTDDEIVAVNIPTGVPLVYEFNEAFEVEKKYYLGNQAAIEEKIASVSNQGKAKA
ncbi:MAG: 2,3-diphosphoglycerate-dependent phosphoglycerate mutase [Eubacteriales bacterium]|nr:2,3-diphosphoglycerate-dependent phosphoglycerate mutase [Eubacteriales bacterium]